MCWFKLVLGWSCAGLRWSSAGHVLVQAGPQQDFCFSDAGNHSCANIQTDVSVLLLYTINKESVLNNLHDIIHNIVSLCIFCSPDPTEIVLNDVYQNHHWTQHTVVALQICKVFIRFKIILIDPFLKDEWLLFLACQMYISPCAVWPVVSPTFDYIHIHSFT